MRKRRKLRAKELSGKKLNAPIDAYKFLEKLPTDRMAYLMAETRNSAALSKIKAYLTSGGHCERELPVVREELTRIGMPAGPKFDDGDRADVRVAIERPRQDAGRAGKDAAESFPESKSRPKQKEPKSKDKKAAARARRRHTMRCCRCREANGKEQTRSAAKAAAKAAKHAAKSDRRNNCAGSGKKKAHAAKEAIFVVRSDELRNISVENVRKGVAILFAAI